MSTLAGSVTPGFPRYFRFGRYWINSYKVFLCVGIYAGTLASAALAERSGIPPLRMGIGCVAFGLLGVAGARIYHLIIHAAHYVGQSRADVWNPDRGGMNVFGGLLTVVPMSFALAYALNIPFPVFWDHLSAGVLVGGFWIRLGCVFNGCCVGRPTTAWYGVWLHDTRGVRTRRVPVQFLEMAWWLLGIAAFLWLWPRARQPGNAALAVLAWYGFARFWLDPLRAASDRVFGRVRIDRVVAGLLAAGAGGALAIRILAH